MKTELEKIVSVAGKPGIYQVVSSGKQASIVESLVDGKRIPVHPTQKVSTLSDITMFTLDDDLPLRVDDDLPLRDILLNAKEVFKGGAAPDPKSDSKTLRDAMKKIVPNYDAERVYDSDIKKLLQWYNILQAKDMLDFVVEEEETESSKEEAEPKAKKTAKKATSKKDCKKSN